MIALKELKNSSDLRVLDGFLMDNLAKETMKALNLSFFRSTKNREEDREKAIAKYGDKVDLSLYAIHHTYSGLVGLAPRELHESVKHMGYFYRLKASA